MAGTSPLEEPPGYYANMNFSLGPSDVLPQNHKTEDQDGSTRDVASSATYQEPRRMEPAYYVYTEDWFVTLCFYANLVKNIEYSRVKNVTLFNGNG